MDDDTFKYDLIAPDNFIVTERPIIGIKNTMAAGRKFCEIAEAEGGFFGSGSWRLSPAEFRGQTTLLRHRDDGYEYAGNLGELLERENNDARRMLPKAEFMAKMDNSWALFQKTILEQYAKERQAAWENSIECEPDRSLEHEPEQGRQPEEPEP